MAVIRSVSLSTEEDQFLKERNLSPSSILQTAIAMIKKRVQLSGSVDDWHNEQKILTLALHVQKMATFMEKKGIAKDFVTYLKEGEQ